MSFFLFNQFMSRYRRHDHGGSTPIDREDRRFLIRLAAILFVLGVVAMFLFLHLVIGNNG